MNLTFIPLLSQQRDIYRIPLGLARFREYLNTMIDWEKEEPRLPLISMNPMAKEHVSEFLDRLLAADVESIAASVAIAAAGEYPEIAGDVRISQIVVDDLKGGWTNRYSGEYAHRFQHAGLACRNWLLAHLWTSSAAGVPTGGSTEIQHLQQSSQIEAAATVHRYAYVQKHGTANTLAQMLTQEGYALSRAGASHPSLDADDLEYTREVIAPFLDTPASDMRTCIEILFGDAGARSLGFTPRGLSPWAGIALALHDSQVLTARSA